MEKKVLHCDEVKKIMNHRLPFFVRWGMWMITIVLAIFIAIIVFFEVPANIREVINSVTNGLVKFQ